MRANHLILSSVFLFMGSISYGQSLAISPGMNVIGTPKFIYCELQGTTIRYGFEGSEAKEHRYAGGAINLSAYQNALNLENLTRDKNEENDIINQNHSMNLMMNFLPGKGVMEIYNVHIVVDEDLFGGGSVLNIFNTVKINDVDLAQVIKQVKIGELENFKIDYSAPEYHPKEQSSSWVDSNGKKTYTLELRCRQY
jgi:hypothetical protein